MKEDVGQLFAEGVVVLSRDGKFYVGKDLIQVADHIGEKNVFMWWKDIEEVALWARNTLNSVENIMCEAERGYNNDYALVDATERRESE